MYLRTLYFVLKLHLIKRKYLNVLCVIFAVLLLYSITHQVIKRSNTNKKERCFYYDF